MFDIKDKTICTVLYEHHDKDGQLINDYDKVLYCDESEIDKSRIAKLLPLLKPVSNAKDTLVPLEAAKLLAAWGVDEAIDYFEYCIDNRIDKLGNLSPHRIYGYDTTYEEIESSLLHYYARQVDKSNGERAYERIEPILKKIIKLAKELPYNMMNLLKEIKDENWRNFEPDLKDCLIEFIQRPGDDRNTKWNIHDLKELLQEWDLDFICQVTDD